MCSKPCATGPGMPGARELLYPSQVSTASEGQHGVRENELPSGIVIDQTEAASCRSRLLPSLPDACQPPAG